MDEKKILEEIAQIIFNKKGENIFALDLRSISSLTDYLLIAEGAVERHLQGIAKEIIASLEEKGVYPQCVEGMEYGDWIVIDYLTVIVHLFLPQLRQKYELEKLWKEGKIVDLNIKVSP